MGAMTILGSFSRGIVHRGRFGVGDVEASREDVPDASGLSSASIDWTAGSVHQQRPSVSFS